MYLEKVCRLIDFNFFHILAPKLVKCEEDDEFVNMFDKMMNETIRESKASIPKSQEMDIVAPVHLRQNKKSYGKYILCNLFIIRLYKSLYTGNT